MRLLLSLVFAALLLYSTGGTSLMKEAIDQVKALPTLIGATL